MLDISILLKCVYDLDFPLIPMLILVCYPKKLALNYFFQIYINKITFNFSYCIFNVCHIWNNIPCSIIMLICTFSLFKVLKFARFLSSVLIFFLKNYFTLLLSENSQMVFFLFHFLKNILFLLFAYFFFCIWFSF